MAQFKFILWFQIFLIILLRQCTGSSESTSLSDEQYFQMPELFDLDNYPKCLSQKGGVFCMGNFELLSETPNQLYDVIKKYSEDAMFHFNHTRIHRGACLGPSTRCPIINDSYSQSFEDCINKNIMEQYNLQARLYDLEFCKTKEDQRKFDTYDWMFIIYIASLIGLNIVGTVYDVYLRDRKQKGNALLLCFSIKANWARFVGGSGGSDKRYSRMKCFNGIRGLIALLVHAAHVPIYMMVYSGNPRFFELNGDSVEFVILTNGTVVIQGYLVISVFLRVFKTLIDSEKRTPGVMTVLTAALDRFVRVGSLFITAVGFSSTLAAHMGDGPVWTKYVDQEAQVCRNHFWVQTFLLQHWFAPACLPQAWYLSMDFQLYVICTGITVWLIRRNKEVIKPMLCMLAASILGLFWLVYTWELLPNLLTMTPENLYSLFKEDKSFLMLYQSLWGNFPGAILGMITAFIYYKVLQDNVDLKQNKMFVFLFRLTVPLAGFYLVSGVLVQKTMTSRFTVSLYGTLDKPFFATLVSIFILGCFVEIKHAARNAMEWPGWVLISRLSLASLLSHTSVAKIKAATRLYPPTFSRVNFVFEWFSMITVTFLLSLPLCLMIEYPMMAAYKTFVEKKLQGSPNETAMKIANGNSANGSTNGHAKIKSN